MAARLASQLQRGWVVGVDSSDSMIEAARRYLLPNLSFLLVDAQDARFYAAHPETFDLVVAFHSIHWMEDQPALFQGAMTALKPGGRLIARMAAEGFDPVYEIADELIQSGEWREFGANFSDPMHRLSVKELANMVEEIGFELVRLERVEESDCIGSEERLKRQIASWLPHTEGMGGLQKGLFLDQLVVTYLDRFPPDEEGRVQLYDTHLELEVRKPGCLSYDWRY